MKPAPHHEAAPGRIRLAVLRDPREAERWQDGLEAAGIDARVEIDDAQRALPGETLLPGVMGGGQPMFVYPLTVAAADRARAAAVLIDGPKRGWCVQGTGHVSDHRFDLGWDGRRSGRRRLDATPATLLRGALIALIAGAAVLALRVAIG